MALIQEELLMDPIELTDAELQDAMNKFRASKQLFKAEDTLAWLTRHGMSQEKLERYVAESAIVPKLRDKITAERVESYFRDHAADFDTLRTACLEVADESQARQLAEQIRSGELDFYAAAERYFCEASKQGLLLNGMLFNAVDRHQEISELSELLFAASPGALIGPLPATAAAGYVLIRVLEIVPAQLDERTRTAIKKILFDRWLEERRQSAHIEWCWGNASKTG
jgi:putative peptide maturation system protein